MAWRLHRYLSPLFFILFLMIPYGRLAAYPAQVDYDGALMRWNISSDTPSITYGVESDEASLIPYYRPVVDAAATLWNGVHGSYARYVPAADGASADVTIHLDGSIGHLLDTAGYTQFDQYNGDLPVHCSIHVLVDGSQSYYSLSKTFLHEMGHGLGLGHSMTPSAIMSYSLDKNSFKLDVDDHAAVARIYPNNGDKPQLPLGCAVLSPRTKPTGSMPALILVLLLMMPSLLTLRALSGKRIQTEIHRTSRFQKSFEPSTDL